MSRTTMTATMFAACALLGLCSPAVRADVAHDRYYYLGEIGGCSKLAGFLAAVPGTVHANATLVVDRACVGVDAIKETLVLPDRFTLAGVGINGEGMLQFRLPENASAIRFAASAGVVTRMATIRDLTIVGGCCGQTGIDVSHSQFVYIRNVRLQDFAFGLSGSHAFSIFVDGSAIHNNATNIVIGQDTTAWRIRDTVTSQGLIGIQIRSTGRGHVVSGGRVEGNSSSGIQVAGAMNVIENTWFEGNGGVTAIFVTGQAQKTRILGNLFSSQLVSDLGTETQMCFNMSFADDSADVNGC
jgi:hypothetical protein